ncbi:MAG: phosphoglycerate dehydrogenase [Clostridiales bacterium]|nr:phosphoglycerate dehydrogenase [Clostridiales bacterium]
MKYQIKLLNSISPKIKPILQAERYQVAADIENPDAILLRSYSLHGYAFGKDLVAVARAGAGVNNIPVEECSKAGIVVFNTPGANANAVKELVLCGMLLTGRRVVEGIEWLGTLSCDGTDVEREVEQGKKQFVGPEMADKKLGVVGLGAVGVQVANAAHYGLNMQVFGYDPYISVAAAWSLSRSVIRASSLEQLFAECDYLTLHLPLTQKTEGIIGVKELSAMRDKAVLLNFARGGLVEDSAVLEALATGRLRAYVTDFPNERLLGVEGVLAIPHLGASTPESEEKCAVMAAQQLQNYLEDGNIRNSVNLPECDFPRTSVHRVCIINRNVTNMVGQIGTLLAEYNHNIDHMINKSKGDWAYTLLDLSTRPGSECVARIAAIEGVVRVRVI